MITKIESEHQFDLMHRAVIGASEISAVLGLNKYRSAFEVYCAKRGLSDPVKENEPMYWGKRLEDIILDEFERRTKLLLERNCFAVSDYTPFLGAQLDALIYNPDGTVAATIDAKNIGRPIESEWGESLSDEVPDQYNLQLQQQMYCTGAELGYLAVLFRGSEYRTYVVEYRPDMMKDIIERAKTFWQGVLDGVPPAPSNKESEGKLISALYPSHLEDIVEATPEQVALMSDQKSLKWSIDELAKKLTEVENTLKLAIGANRGLAGQGWKATWTKTKDRLIIDWEAVSAALNPPLELVAKNTTTKEGYRVLRVTADKEK